MDRLFYDGGCGLCHWLVRFVARHDRAGRFRFAPLDGATFRRYFSDRERAAFPQSLVIRTATGNVHTRSDAVVYVLKRLGGTWALVAGLLQAVPRSVRDAGYEVVARLRRRLFPAPAEQCPALPPELRERFEA